MLFSFTQHLARKPPFPSAGLTEIKLMLTCLCSQFQGLLGWFLWMFQILESPMLDCGIWKRSRTWDLWHWSPVRWQQMTLRNSNQHTSLIWHAFGLSSCFRLYSSLCMYDAWHVRVMARQSNCTYRIMLVEGVNCLPVVRTSYFPYCIYYDLYIWCKKNDSRVCLLRL